MGLYYLELHTALHATCYILHPTSHIQSMFVFFFFHRVIHCYRGYGGFLLVYLLFLPRFWGAPALELLYWVLGWLVGWLMDGWWMMGGWVDDTYCTVYSRLICLITCLLLSCFAGDLGWWVEASSWVRILLLGLFGFCYYCVYCCAGGCGGCGGDGDGCYCGWFCCAWWTWVLLCLMDLGFVVLCCVGLVWLEEFGWIGS